jgi:hypothetical protein
MADPAETENQNILPVQALFNVDKSFNTFIGQGQPFIVSATESIGIQDVTALDATLYPTLSPVSTGQVTTLDVTSTKLTFNPSTGVLSATTFAGFLSGTASTANNFANGTSGQIPYQTSANNTSFITNGVLGQVLTSNGSGAPTWSNPTAAITLQDDTSTNSTFYPLFANNTTGFVSTEFTSSTKYQFNPFTGVLTATGFAGAGTGLTGTASSLSIGGNAATATSAITATNLAGGANGSVPYQTGSGATAMLSAGSNGQILTLASGVPTWAAAPSTSLTITDDTTTNATRYLTFTSATAGSVTGENVSSTKLQYNPSTGTLTTTAFASASVAITGGSVNGTTVGATTASTGAFTTLSASSTVSGSGFSTYLASPPAIGGTTPAAGTFTTLIGGADVANYGQLTGGATTKAVEFKSLGTDTNVAYAIRSKGTGAIDLAAGSSGVNISNGGTVTALTRTATGTLYTTVPTVAISAPTTAGGVQATATANLSNNVTVPTITSGGTGYTAGDTLTLVGGTFTAVSTLTVSTVSSGVITGITVAVGGVYSVVPTNPMSVTGGTGSGATFTLNNWGLSATFTITNAGSGYVEQPTVTFSGGGGSGAAAYATVGSQTIIKGLGTSSGTISNQSIMFQTPAGNSLLLRDSGQATPDAHMMVQATANGYALAIAEGSNANASLYVGAKGAGSIRFNTQSTSLTEQMRVTNTTSAVNYVNVTGGIAGTPGTVTISGQGSSANIDIAITPKGTGAVKTTANAYVGSSLYIAP